MSITNQEPELLEGEIFVPIHLPEFNGKYMISNKGRLKSIRKKSRKHVKDFITKGCHDTKGYFSLCLRDHGLCVRIRAHVLVGEAFLIKPKTESRLCINHIDGNKLNNNVENLEWVTYKQNSEHAIKTGLMDTKGEKNKKSILKESDILEIRKLYHTNSRKKIAKMYNVNDRYISSIVTGDTWKHLPLEDYSKRTIPNFKKKKDVTK